MSAIDLSHELPATADVVIIGGGIAGAASAFFASRAGLRAVVIERRPALGSLNTSAATGAFRAQFDNPDEMALVREGIAFYARFADETDLPGFDLGMRTQGYLWCARTEATAARQRELVERQRGWGLDDVELLSADQVRLRFPYVSRTVVQARWRAGDGWLDPKRLTAGYALASGARFVTETDVLGFVSEAGRVRGVRTSRGTITAGAVVLAAGTFSDVLAGTLGLSLGLSCVRRMRIVVPEVPEVPQWAPMTIDEETGAHWRPWRDGAHCMWTQPRVPAGPPLDDVPASDAFVFSVLDPASANSVAVLTPFWRDVWARHSTHWYVRAGQYDYTRDHRPLIGPASLPGLYLNTGYSGHGIMCSAGGARLLIDTLTGRLAPAANPFRPDREIAERALDVI